MTDTSNAPVNVFTAPPVAPASEPKPPIARVEGTRPTPATNQVDVGPQERWLADKAATERADPWLDPNRVLVRRPDGLIEQRERIVGPDGEIRPGKLIEGQDNASGDPLKPDGGERIKIGDSEYTEEELRALMVSKAAEDSRKALVPPAPSDYKAELPKDLKLPGDTAFTFNPNDPIKGAGLKTAMEWAHRNQLSQGQFSELLGVYAAAQAHEMTMISNAAKAEKEALGFTGPARVDAISTFLRGHLGDKAAQPFLATLVTASQVNSWETLMSKLINGGVSFSGGGRDAAPVGISEEAYEKMSYGERVEYAQNATAAAARAGRR